MTIIAILLGRELEHLRTMQVSLPVVQTRVIQLAELPPGLNTSFSAQQVLAPPPLLHRNFKIVGYLGDSDRVLPHQHLTAVLAVEDLKWPGMLIDCSVSGSWWSRASDRDRAIALEEFREACLQELEKAKDS